MKLKKYSHYKDSHIDWIWEIPEDWEIMKVKHFSNTVAWWTPSTSNESFWEWNIPWLPSGLVHDNRIKESEIYKFISFEALNNSSTKWIKPNSVLIALTWATCGNIWYIDFRTTANQSVIWMEVNDKMDSIFLFYYLLTQKEQILINQTWWAQWWINQENVRDILCSVPPLQTQKRISSFLDSKTKKLENLIEKDKKLIELLKERRVSLINKAVTKGLDDSVKMKDSWIEWIWEIPESWEVRKLSQCFDLIWSGTTPTSWDEIYHDNWTINWLLTWDLNDWYITETSKKVTIKAMRDYSALKLHPENSLAIAMYWATIWKIWLTKIKTTTNQACCVLNKSNIFDMKFIFYWFLANKKEIISLSYWWGQPNISQEIIKFLKVQTPKIQEQQRIVEFLDKETEKIDNHIKKVERRIELYEEYKKSLIYNVVTGKVEV